MTSRQPRAFGIPIEPDLLLPPDRYPFGSVREGHTQSDGGARLIALARALATSPVWEGMEQAILVVRPDPPQGIAFLGYFSDEEVRRLEWLSVQLRDQLPYLRYVSWPEAETTVEELAGALVEHFGVQTVRDMTYMGIPRGGTIVLGMLAYALDLGRSNLSDHPDQARPLVVVDDCALSGLRSLEFLRNRVPGREQVVLAHLFSHPDLRGALMDREPRILAALAARDLRDLAPELVGDRLPEWRTRWKERSGEATPWIGNPEHVVFPWAEPDLGFWDEASGEARTGWRIVPPEACLKNRWRDGARGARRLRIQPPSAGAVSLAPGVFHGEAEGQILLAEVESGRSVALAGVAADFWRAFLTSPSADLALERLAALFETPESVLRKDAGSFLRELRDRGFLTRIPELAPLAPPHRPHA